MSNSDLFDSPVINTALTDCFGDISGLSVDKGADSAARAIDAMAFSSGGSIGLSSGVEEDPSDPLMMQIIGHEVAHGLAPASGSSSLLDGPGDASESAADNAGQAFADYISSGLFGPAPSLGAATGGGAAIHRWAGYGHAQGMREAGSNATGNVSGGARSLIAESTFTLGRGADGTGDGVEVNAADIAPLMDFYGVVDPNSHEMDVSATMAQIRNAPPEELTRLRDYLRREADEGPEAAASNTDFEWVTRRREEHRSYLDSAAMNDTHFSGRDRDRADNNVGTYRAFHSAALESAGGGNREDALLAEAMSMHFLEDSFASGHSFDKSEAMGHMGGAPGLVNDITGFFDPSATDDDVVRNLYAKRAHDELNREGVTFHNAAGESWRGLGDSSREHDRWHDEDNADNRRRTIGAIGTSYDELGSVLNAEDPAAAERAVREARGDRSHGGFAAEDAVPVFDENIQHMANRINDDTGLIDIIADNYKDIPDILGAKFSRWIVNPVEGAISWLGDMGSDALSWLGDRGADALDLGSDALSWLGDRGNDALDLGNDALSWLGDRADDAQDAAGVALSWLGDRGNDALDLGDDALSWLGDRGDDALDLGSDALSWLGDRGNDALDLGGDALSWLGDRGNDALDMGANAVSWLGDRGNDALDLGSDAVSWVGDRGNDALDLGANAVSWLGDRGNDALDLGSDAVSWLGDRGNDVLDAGSAAASWVGDTASDAYDTVASLIPSLPSISLW